MMSAFELIPLSKQTDHPRKPKGTLPFVLLTFDFFVWREDFSSGSKSPVDPRRRILIGHKLV